MKTATTFTNAGWDFASLWGIGNINNGYPFFSSSLEPQGDGTPENPYKIQTLANLYWLSQTPTQWDKHFEQTSDIDASETSTWNSGAGWSPIGIYFYFGNPNQAPFTGKYNGGGYTISNLYINRPSQGERIGLFGWTQGATIETISLSSISITGENYVGGVVGYADNTSITRCNVSGLVTMRQQVGGIAGYATNASSISYCTVSANITAKVTAGGIVGFNDASTISLCYSTGNISASTGEESYYYGGIAGLNKGEIRSCFSRSNVVSGMERGGGLVGDNDMGGTISNSYSTGAISVLGGYYIGGLTGLNSGTVTNSFWDIQTSGMATSTAGIGKTTEEMKAYETFFNASWDFRGETTNGVDDIWNIGNSTNDGYPYFNWTSPSDLAPQFITFSEIDAKTYGDTSFELTASSSTGLPVSFSSSNENIAEISYNTVTIVGAGTVSIHANQEGNETYNPAQTKSTQLIVAKAPLTVIAADKNKVYNGLPFTYEDFTASISGFVYIDNESHLNGTLTFTGEATTEVDFGSYSIMPGGLESDNYEIEFYSGMLNITKAPLTATAESKQKVYGSANPEFTILYEGFVNDENESVITEPTAASDANELSPVDFYSINLSGGSAANYDITLVDGELEVTKATLIASANSLERYFGQENPELTISYGGFVNSETVSVIDNLPIASTTATPESPVGEYDITLSGGVDNNYTIELENGTLTVLAIPTYVVTFNVTANESPVENATIDINSDLIYTNESGEATIELANGTYNYAISANGYEGVNGEIAIENENETINIDLVPLNINVNSISRVNVYPNPFRNQLNIANASNISCIMVSNMLGQIVTTVSNKGNETMTLDESLFKTGVYFLTVKYTNGTIGVAKVIKE